MTLSKIKYRYFSLLFLISGFAGIIYESVWIQYLKILSGHAAFAQTFILIIFLSGLAIGAWIGGYLLPRFSRLFVIYAFAEALIGIFALLFHPLFELIRHFLFSVVYPSGIGVWMEVVKWGLVILITLPATSLLGATFPLLATALQRLMPDRKGSIVAQLYFLNSLGAAIGILICTFILIPDLGSPGTIIAAGILNIVIAVFAYIMAGKDLDSGFAPTHFDSNQKPNISPLFYYIMLAALFTGASSFMYEIGWVRMLSMVLGSSVHAFEMMLSAFIFGLAIGAFWIKMRIEKIKNPELTFLRVQILMGIFAILSIIIYNNSFVLMEWILQEVERDEPGFLIFNTCSHIVAFVVMLPATICAGMTLPLMIQILQLKGFGEGVVGRVYAVDTAGGILGVLLAVHFLMPLFGLKYLMIIAGSVDIILGMGMLIFFGRKFPDKFFLFPIIGVIALPIFFIFINPDPVKMASGVFRYGSINEQNTMLFQRDGKTASIAVYETQGGNIVLSTNGKPDASINRFGHVSADDATQVLLAALPMSLSYDLSKVAIIGLGSGKTAHVALMNYQITKLDVIEIEPAVAEAAGFFRPFTDNIFNDFRFSLYLNDARTFLTTSPEKYDLIISEPSNPWVSGMSSLFSAEFYQIISSGLADKGMFVQWVHTYEMNMPLIASIAKAFSPKFSDFQLYFLDDGDVVFIGKKNGIITQPNDAIFYNPEMKVALHRLGIESYDDLLLRYVGNKVILDSFFFSFQKNANSDYFPILEYEAPKVRFLGQSANGLQELIDFPAPILRSLLNTKVICPDSLGADYTFGRAEKFRQAQIIYNIFKAAYTSHDPDYTGLEDFNVLLVKNILSLRRNNFPGSPDDTWVIYLNSFAAAVNPFLEPEKLGVIWDYIMEAPAFKGQSDALKLEVELYKAAGRADYKNILDLTSVFRRQSVFLPEKMEMYQLTVTLWALLMENQNDEALMIWEKFRKPQEIPAMLQLLGALAESRCASQK